MEDCYTGDADLHKAQMIMLDMLNTVHCICEDNNIRYWLDAGTLLGCIRHQGFIPWDDDVDIAMPREDFEKFIIIAKQLLPSDMFLQNKETDKLYRKNITKIRKRYTKIIEYTEVDNEPYHQGIFIDIFPFDYYPSKKFTKFIRFIDTYRDFRKRYKAKTLKRFLVNIFIYIIMFIPIKVCKIFKSYFVLKRDKFFSDSNAPVMGHRIDVCPISGIYKKDIFPLKKEIEFERFKFYIPNNYHEYLVDEFGDDYMTLPPLEKRATHARKILLNVKEQS